MDYKSTLVTLERFWNVLSRFSQHRLSAWAILYPMVKVTISWEFLMVVNKAPSSLYVDS